MALQWLVNLALLFLNALFFALFFGKWGKLTRSKYLEALGVAPKSHEVL